MIELKNLAIGYDEYIPVLKNINYTFEDNKIYGILGQSGYGKTTLLKTICGLLKPLDGQVLINNKPLIGARENNIYMMFQNYTCFDWLSCIDNILLAKKIKSNIVREDVNNALKWLDKVGLLDKKENYPTELSGGQKQRLALARTLFMSPDIVLMDEPLSALDEKTRKDMQDLIIQDHKQDKNIIIMITHSKEEAERVCDVIIDITKEKGFNN